MSTRKTFFTPALQRLLLLLLLLGLSLALFSILLHSLAARSCYTLYDPLHVSLKAIDLSAYVFPLTWLPVPVFILSVYRHMQKLQCFVLAYTLVVVTRMLCITLLPLCEPPGAIALHDGLLNAFFYPNGYSPLDLMYSGHTATLFLLFLFSGKYLRLFFLSACLAVGAMLVLQKVHYTADVLVAFPMTWLCYFCAKKIIPFPAYEKKQTP